MSTGEIREQLLRRRAEIMSSINNLGKHVGHREEALDSNPQERAFEIENLDVLFAIDSATRLEFRQINDAIERIEIGHYGLCSKCGAAISPERLAVLPYVDTCISCAQQLDSNSH